MEQAKQAVSSFLTKDGHHRTDVDEVVNPAVTSETVKPTRHEETTEAVDREVHRDHYHTTVQPLQHKEVLPEQHTHNIVPQVERTFEHGSAEQDRSRVAAELGSFRDTSRTEHTTHSTSAAPQVTGEHVHHHVHETVQPVIHKETIQPEVVHTTVPIHETHIAPSEHHGMSSLPVKTLEEFQQGGVSLTEGHKAHHEYDGHPRSYDPKLQLERKPVDVNPRAHDGTHDPVKTGHYSDVDSSARGTSTTGNTGLTSTTGTTGTTGTSSTGPLHQSTDERHGSGLLGGAAAGTAAGAGVAGLSSHHGDHGSTSRSLGRDETMGTTPGDGAYSTGFAPTSSGVGRDETLGTTTGTSSTGIGSTGHDHRHGPTDTVSSTSKTLTDNDSSSRSHGANSGTYQGDRNEPSNLSGGAKHNDSDTVQHASDLGEDPSLTKNKEAESGKWRGDGVPGSHSAVFGLTKTGEKFDDTSNFLPGAPHSANESKDEKKKDSGVGEDTGSRAEDTGSGKVAEQMRDLKVADKSHDGSAEYKPESTSKPGFGADTSKII